MAWGLFVPGLSFLVVSFNPVILTKAAFTVAIGVLLATVLSKDDWVQALRARAQARLKEDLVGMFARFRLGKTGKH